MGILDFIRLKAGKATRLTLPDARELTRVAPEMTQFDWYTSRLCESTHRDRQSAEATVNFGMLYALRETLGLALNEPRKAEMLLTSKADRGEDVRDWLLSLEGVADVVGEPSTWQQIRSKAHRDGVPCIVDVVTMLVSIFDQRHSRPVGRAFAGYYAAVTDHVAAAGLFLGLNHREVARHLVDEPFLDPDAAMDVLRSWRR